jgi:hypothetical protein
VRQRATESQVLAADGVQPGWRAALEGQLIRIARICYDHLAGNLGWLTGTMVRRRYLEPSGKDLRLMPAGERLFVRWGLDLDAARSARRRFARQCLDWSERRPHLAGTLRAPHSLGAALNWIGFVDCRGRGQWKLRSEATRVSGGLLDK